MSVTSPSLRSTSTVANPEVVPDHVTRINEAKTPTGPGRPGASTAHITPSTAHLSTEDIERIGAELEAMRDEVMSSLGEADAQYIRRVIKTQRGLEIAGRIMLLGALFPPAFVLGTASLGVAKILENMEIGHNVLHGQWDWMRDPEIHSTTWEWDAVSTAEGWQHAHNYLHHTYTNVHGKDRDIGYNLLRIDPDQPWAPHYLFQFLSNAGLALIFEWGIAMFDLEIDEVQRGEKTWADKKPAIMGMLRKAGKQMLKDYVVFPALSGPSFVPAAVGGLVANLMRNVWGHAVIFCGHFPVEVETFDEERLENESQAEWYVRQMLGSANIEGSTLLHIMTGNLSHQIEHHLFPDMPSNHYARIAPQVRDLCRRYGLPYHSGPMWKQYGGVLWKIARLSFPGGHEAVEKRRRRGLPVIGEAVATLRRLRDGAAPAAA
ncbi:acyl-CoA desaturase [Actinomycetospora endophytica]|uniref:Acyl-CoA desaturase n=1 Tax=Actinomycetospora endophytica TaxID=2291215 RepID=A0ABS8PEB3_9PSEU|nr:acyl-CoA desaturase [Actinomycetospora endophytica]MCD2196613.1 acyl-CoA desaturase [Actinomycetospora endophytica]